MCKCIGELARSFCLLLQWLSWVRFRRKKLSSIVWLAMVERTGWLVLERIVCSRGNVIEQSKQH